MRHCRTLHASITVMQQTRQWLSRASSHLKRVQRPYPPGAFYGQEARLSTVLGTTVPAWGRLTQTTRSCPNQQSFSRTSPARLPNTTNFRASECKSDRQPISNLVFQHRNYARTYSLHSRTCDLNRWFSVAQSLCVYPRAVSVTPVFSLH